MINDELNARREIIKYAQKMNPSGINVNKSGNVSARYRDGFIITPTGIPYDQLTEEDLVYVRKESNGYSFVGEYEASSEWFMHAKIYESREDVEAIVHTHSLYATAIACLEEDIPPFHYMVAVSGNTKIPCAPYALFGTEALADSCLKGLGQGNACLLSHHGVICVGKTVRKAFELAVEVENLAHMWTEVRKVNPDVILSEQQMKEVMLRFKTYGQQLKKEESKES